MPIQSIGHNSSRMLKENPSGYLKAIRLDIANIIDSSDDSLRRKLGDVYAAARVLSLDIDHWQSFCEQDEWESFPRKPKPIASDQKNALQHAIRYAVGFGGVKANQAAYRYRKALEGCWRDDVLPAEVPALIKKSGGLEKMKQKNVRKGTVLTVDFAANYYTRTIVDTQFAGYAILVVRFGNGDSRKRHARIVVGQAKVKGGCPNLSDFNRRFNDWKSKQFS